MVSFVIHPKDSSIRRVGGIDKEDEFYNIIHKDCDDDELSNKIVEWSELHCLRVPPVLYEKWRNVFVR